jgi:hypothetical protein
MVIPSLKNIAKRDQSDWPNHGRKKARLHWVEAGSDVQQSSDQDNGRSAKATWQGSCGLTISARAPSAWTHHACLLPQTEPRKEIWKKEYQTQQIIFQTKNLQQWMFPYRRSNVFIKTPLIFVIKVLWIVKWWLLSTHVINGSVMIWLKEK